MKHPGTITSRPFVRERDGDRLYGFVAATPDVAPHLVDLPWRLASPAAQVPDNGRLWLNSAGEIVAWAILQHEWMCVDFGVDPRLRTTDDAPDILGWAVERLTDDALRAKTLLERFLSAREDDRASISWIERAGFTPAGWSYQRLARDLRTPIEDAPLADGFRIRPLAGEAEVDAYVAAHRAAFESTTMTSDWRRRTLRDGRYVADLDLVAVAPDGTVAGFCVVWITPPSDEHGTERIAQIEPFGVVPAYRRRGIGRALLAEAIRRAAALGATRLEVDTVSGNDASAAAYMQAGFRPWFTAPFFERTFVPPMPGN